MENTSPFLFDNTDEKYFLALRGRAVGPLTSQEVYERVQSGEAGLLHYLWREGWSDWKRVCDDREFAVLVPQKPSPSSIGHIRERLSRTEKAGRARADGPPLGEDIDSYYLYFNRTQYGPFSRNELLHVLKSHNLGKFTYLWKAGWPNWKPLHELQEFALYLTPETAKEITRTEEPSVRILKKSRAASQKKTRTISKKTIGAKLATEAGVDTSEKRRAPRRPLVARLFLHNNEDVIIAVCRDISIGGMQVLTDRVPGAVGSIIKLNVSPGGPTTVKSFVAEGEIVRLLEDSRGFSFRFTKISEEARKAIASYIKSDF